MLLFELTPGGLGMAAQPRAEEAGFRDRRLFARDRKAENVVLYFVLNAVT